jgi:hypothetical protein
MDAAASGRDPDPRAALRGPPVGSRRARCKQRKSAARESKRGRERGTHLEKGDGERRRKRRRGRRKWKKKEKFFFPHHNNYFFLPPFSCHRPQEVRGPLFPSLSLGASALRCLPATEEEEEESEGDSTTAKGGHRRRRRPPSLLSLSLSLRVPCLEHACSPESVKHTTSSARSSGKNRIGSR